LFEASDSPVAKKNEVTPKLRMVARTIIESATSNEVIGGGVQSESEQARRMLMEDSEDDSDQLKIRTMERLKDANKKQSFHNFNEVKKLRH
jgi:histidyl-tRNA synthetase